MDINRKITIYGAGKRGGSLIELMELCNRPIGHIVDSNQNLWGKNIGNYRIESPQILQDETDTLLCITMGNSSAVVETREMLRQRYQFPLCNEISYYGLIMDLYAEMDAKKWLAKKEIGQRDRITVIFDCEAGIGLGGIEEWTKGICKKFIEAGDYRAYILTDYGSYNIPEELGDHILRVDLDKRQMFSTHNVEQILNCLADHLPCVIVTSQPDQTLLSGKILKELFGSKVKVISGIRGGYAEINKSYLQMRNCTDLYVGVNSAIRTDMIERGVSPEHVYTMLCPVECPDTLRRGYSSDAKEPLKIGYAGRLEEDKRMDLMIKLLQRLEHMQVNYKIEFAGEGSYEEKIKMLITEYGCGDRVKLLGKVDKQSIPLFWQDKDVCVNISDQEGRSRSTIEAMANGAVPVVTDTWGVEDDIVDGENGFIVKVGDYEAIAERLRFLCGNRENLSTMGQRAHEELKKKCSMEEHYRFWQKIIGLVAQEMTE